MTFGSPQQKSKDWRSINSMNTQDPKSIALAFNDCITRQDINGLAGLMTEDHTFIDREGKISRPKKVMIEGWKKFFEMFPRYKNTFTRVESKDDLVTMLGYAYWSEEQPRDNAIWTATVVEDLVAEWRIYYDTDENRRIFQLSDGSQKP